jgi:urease accessory protein
MVAGAGGPLGGDELHLDIDVAAGAQLRIGSAAAMVVQPGQPGAGDPADVARFTVRAELGAGASLYWEPEPTVVTAGAALESSAHIRCAGDVNLVWREILVRGRLDQLGGTMSSALICDVDERPVLRQTTRVGPGSAPGWDGPAGLAGQRVLGTVLLLGAAAGGIDPIAADGAAPYAVMRLEGGGVLVTALGATTLDVRRALGTALVMRCGG